MAYSDKYSDKYSDNLGSYGNEYRGSLDSDGRGSISETGSINQEFSEKKRQSTVVQSLANLANSAIGAGALGFPYAYKSAGLGLAAGLSLMVLTISVCTLHIVVRSAVRQSCSSYQGLVRKTLGVTAANLFGTLMIIYCWGSCVMYLIIVGDCLHPAVNFFAKNYHGDIDFFLQRKFIISVIAWCLCFPLSMQRTMSALGNVSMLVFGSVTYTALAILIRSFEYGSWDNVELIQKDFSIVQAIPILLFGFQCHVQVVPIFMELAVPKNVKGLSKADITRVLLNRMDIVIAGALGFCCCLYYVISICGYLSWGDKTQANIMKNYGQNDVIMLVARFSIALTVIIAFPVNLSPGRGAIEELFMPMLFKGKVNPDTNTLPFSWMRHTVVTSTWFISSWVLALFVTDLSVVFEVLGSIAANLFILAMPAILLIKGVYDGGNNRGSMASSGLLADDQYGVEYSVKPMDRRPTTSKKMKSSKKIGISLLSFAIIVGIMALVVTFMFG